MIRMETSLPPKSALHQPGKAYDYVDSFRAIAPVPAGFSKDQFLDLFLHSGPPWADVLMKIRDFLVQAYGLKNGNRDAVSRQTYAIGDRAGLFAVYGISENEYILGEDDKHLDFRVSLLISPSDTEPHQDLSISTVVRYHNLFGKLYFIPVKLFHRLIVRSSFKAILKSLKQRN